MLAETAQSIADKASTPDPDKVESHLVKIFVKIERSAKKGSTYIHHKFICQFGGVSHREKILVIDRLIALGYLIGTVRRETDAYRISW